MSHAEAYPLVGLTPSFGKTLFFQAENFAERPASETSQALLAKIYKRPPPLRRRASAEELVADV